MEQSYAIHASRAIPAIATSSGSRNASGATPRERRFPSDEIATQVSERLGSFNPRERRFLCDPRSSPSSSAPGHRSRTRRCTQALAVTTFLPSISYLVPIETAKSAEMAPFETSHPAYVRAFRRFRASHPKRLDFEMLGREKWRRQAKIGFRASPAIVRSVLERLSGAGSPRR